jgi:hypothetical protein
MVVMVMNYIVRILEQLELATIYNKRLTKCKFFVSNFYC